jgi:hypothetical protein
VFSYREYGGLRWADSSDGPFGRQVRCQGQCQGAGLDSQAVVWDEPRLRCHHHQAGCAMCGRFTLFSGSSELARLFGCGFDVPLQPRYNIAPSQEVPVVRLVEVCCLVKGRARSADDQDVRRLSGQENTPEGRPSPERSSGQRIKLASICRETSKKVMPHLFSFPCAAAGPEWPPLVGSPVRAPKIGRRQPLHWCCGPGQGRTRLWPTLRAEARRS